MIDASARPLAENIAAVKQVVAFAHPRGVFVEGEVGRIQGMGVEGMYTGTDFLARLEDVEQFVAESGADSLAAGIGTAHGFYKGKPEIHFDLLEKINKAVKVPLVLHGGTGIPEEDVKCAIRGGINKVNVGTIIHCTYMNAVRAELNARGENAYTLDVMKPARAAVKTVVKEWIKVCMADGKAKGLR
jgi:ketose-bisphosphate aldolase